MNRDIPTNLTEFFSRKERYIIICHADPDGDAICSSLVTAAILERLGKAYELCSPGPFDRPEIQQWAGRFSTSLEKNFPAESTGVVVLDCSTLERIGDFASLIGNYETAVIDHHAGGRPFGDIRFIVPEAPSVTYLIYYLMAALGFSPTTEEAELLLMGFCTDTGFFRHIEGGKGDVFELAAKLVYAGASPKKAYGEMYGGKELNSRKLLGIVLSRTEALMGGEVLYTFETRSDRARMGKVYRDSDMLYSLLQNTRGTEAVVYVREEDDGMISVGLRSASVDISRVALRFGGGGHPKAAGFTWEGTIEELKAPLLEAVKTVLPTRRDS